MAYTGAASVGSSSRAAASSSNGTGSSSSSNTAAHSSSSAAGSSSTVTASPTAMTTTTPATTTPATTTPATITPASTANNRITRRAARNAGVGFPTQPSAMGLERTVRVPLNLNINRILRQRHHLDNRRRVHPKVRYFTKLLDKNLTRLLFRFANKYRPETRADNKRRRKVKKAARAAKAAKAAEAAAAAGNATNENVSAADKKKNKGKAKAVDPLAVAVAAYDKAANKTPYILKYGMNHVAELTEKQRAQLVVMSDDIEPPEVLIWLPALCRMYNVPYAIVKGSARLGTLVNKRSTTAVAFTEIREEEQLEFSQLADAINVCYAKINRQQPVRSSWMGGLLGFKARVKEALRATVTANRLRQQQQQRQQQ